MPFVLYVMLKDVSPVSHQSGESKCTAVLQAFVAMIGPIHDILFDSLKLRHGTFQLTFLLFHSLQVGSHKLEELLTLPEAPVDLRLDFRKFALDNIREQYLKTKLERVNANMFAAKL